MHESLDEVMWPNRYLLTGLGIWPSQPEAHPLLRYFARLRIVVSLALITFMTYPLIVSIAVNWGDIDLLASFGSVAIMYILGALKMIYVMLRRRVCRRVHSKLRDLWEASADAAERGHFEPFARVAQKITIAAFASAAVDIAAFMLSPLVVWQLGGRHENNQTRLALPLPVLYGFDHTRSNVFALLYVGQGFGSTACCMAIFGCDCTFMSVTLQLAGQFRLTSSRWRALGRRVDDGKLALADIGRCIAHHQRVIDLAKEANGLMEPVVFGQIASSGLLLCLCGFVLVVGDPLEPDMLKIYVLFACVIAQLLIWCWPGELLIRESGDVGRAILEDVPWPRLPPRLRRDLGLVLMRAQRECRVSGFYQVMCMRKLTEVFNAAGSYMALLRSFRY